MRMTTAIKIVPRDRGFPAGKHVLKIRKLSQVTSPDLCNPRPPVQMPVTKFVAPS